MYSVKELADTLVAVLDLTRIAGSDTPFPTRLAALVPNKERWELSRVLAGRSVSQLLLDWFWYTAVSNLRLVLLCVVSAGNLYIKLGRRVVDNL